MLCLSSRLAPALVLAVALVVSACSATPAPSTSTSGPTGVASTASVSSSSATDPGASSTAPSSSSPSTSVLPTNPAASGTPRPAEVRAAATVALRLFVRTPDKLDDPSAGSTWSARPWRDSPMSDRLRARLVSLQAQDWFDDRHCREDYVTGNQTGSTQAPRIASSSGTTDGTVTVVIRPYPVTRPRDLTVVLSRDGASWQVTDLARGTGPHASIFSAAPNC